MKVAFLFLLIASPQLVVGGSLPAVLFPPKLISVTVTVDFGPANRPAIEKAVQVREGATPREALKKICRVETGVVCCHPAEVKGIDGVLTDPERGRYWRLEINGEGKTASPHKSRLKAGDRISWFYYNSEDYPKEVS